MKQKVALGIASYGQQSPRFWMPLVGAMANLYKDDIEFIDTYWSGVSNPDVNRNNVVSYFRKDGKADWLWFIDTDNPPPVGALRRLLDVQAPFVSGLYYGGDPDKRVIPIAYIRNQYGRYITISDILKWDKGEILKVDAVGMGCALIHRDIFDTIEREYTVVNRQSGGVVAVPNVRIHGKLTDKYKEKQRMGHIYDGVLYDPVIQIEEPKFPYYECQHNRTEDMVFCEMAREIGADILVDTSVEVGHVKEYTIRGSKFRELEGMIPDGSIQEVDNA